MDRRFRDPGHSVYAFMNPILVKCPRCQEMARASRKVDSAEARVTCASCGYACVAVVEGLTLHSREPRDPYFGLDLWLQTTCCGETLWARNGDHLSFLSEYVRAGIRERATGLEPQAYRNKRMSSRLPRW